MLKNFNSQLKTIMDDIKNFFYNENADNLQKNIFTEIKIK